MDLGIPPPNHSVHTPGFSAEQNSHGLKNCHCTHSQSDNPCLSVSTIDYFQKTILYDFSPCELVQFGQ